MYINICTIVRYMRLYLNLSCAFLLFLAFTQGMVLFAQKITIPKDFCILSQTTQEALEVDLNSSLEITQQYPVFYILTHGTFASRISSRTGHAWGEREFTEQIPQGFFEDERYNEQAPIRLVFGWSGQVNDAARKEGGKLLASGINNIIEQVPQAKIIVLGHSHGGNIINVASQYVAQPIDVVIQLATPILAYNHRQEQFDNERGYLPEKINKLFLYFSMNDFVQSIAAGHAYFKRRYAPIEGIDIYNVRLLVNGNDPLHINMHDKTIGKEILALSNKIQHTYKHNKNLIANIIDKDFLQNKKTNSNLRDADAIICIQPYSPTCGDIFTGKSTDKFWPDWTLLSNHENRLNEQQNAIFKQEFTKDIWHIASRRERLYNIIEEIRYGSPIRWQHTLTNLSQTRVAYSLLYVGQNISNGLQIASAHVQQRVYQAGDAVRLLFMNKL